MPSFGTSSKKKLETCHDSLVAVCELVIETYDFSVLEGYRSGERQDELFRQGKSKLKAGQSKHNKTPSLAIDLSPYPIDWENRERFYLLAGMMFQAATDMGIRLRWGGDWNNNWVHTDQLFHDLPHFELRDLT